MTVILTPEQGSQLATTAFGPAFAIDPDSRRRYVVLGADAYERLQSMFGEASVREALTVAWDDSDTHFSHV